MERVDVERVLDVFAENFGSGWAFHKEDSVHLFLKNENARNPPHVRIRKDNGMMECLCGQFQYEGMKIGYRIKADDFVKLVRG